MAAITIGIIAISCIGLFVAVKLTAGSSTASQPLVSNVQDEKTEHQVTEEEKASLETAIKYGDATEAEAFEKLDASILSRAFTGEKLRGSITEINRLIEQRLYQVSELQNQEFQGFKISPDGLKAEVQVTETWNTVYYSADTNECAGKLPATAMPQTIYLEKVGDVWMQYNIIFDNATQPQLLPCN